MPLASILFYSSTTFLLLYLSVFSIKLFSSSSLAPKLILLTIYSYLVISYSINTYKTQSIFDFLAWLSLFRALHFLSDSSFSYERFLKLFYYISVFSSLMFLIFWDSSVSLSSDRSVLNTTVSACFEDFCYAGLLFFPLLLSSFIPSSPQYLKKLSRSPLFLLPVGLALYCSLLAERRLYLIAIILPIIFLTLYILNTLFRLQRPVSRTLILFSLVFLFALPGIYARYSTRFTRYTSLTDLFLNERVIESLSMLSGLASTPPKLLFGSGFGGTYPTPELLLIAREQAILYGDTNNLFYDVPDETQHVHIFFFQSILRFGLLGATLFLVSSALYFRSHVFKPDRLTSYFLLPSLILLALTGLTLIISSTVICFYIPLLMYPSLRPIR